MRSSRGRDAGAEVLLPDLEFRPIVYVRDMAESVAFYRVLGAEVVHGEPHSEHVLLQLGTVQMRLVARAAVVGAGVVELNFTAAMSLDRLGRRLRAQRVPVDEGLDDIGFGPQLRIRTPDGVIIRIGRLEPEDQA